MTDNTVAAQLERVRTENARLELQIEHLVKRFELFKDHVETRLDMHSDYLNQNEED